MSDTDDMIAVCATKSDQLNADDLIGGDMTITITHVLIDLAAEQRVSIYFAGSERAYRPCKTMCKILSAIWGSSSSEYVGRSLTLYCDPEVTYGKIAVGGIRIKAASHIAQPFAAMLNVRQKVKKLFTIAPLVVRPDEPATPAQLEQISRLALEYVTDSGRFFAHLTRSAGEPVNSLDTMTSRVALIAINELEKAKAKAEKLA